MIVEGSRSLDTVGSVAFIFDQLLVFLVFVGFTLKPSSHKLFSDECFNIFYLSRLI